MARTSMANACSRPFFFGMVISSSLPTSWLSFTKTA